jgi:hypothetical protein
MSPRPAGTPRFPTHFVVTSIHHWHCEKTSHFGPPRSRLAARRPARPRGAGGTCAAMRRAGRCCGVRCGERPVSVARAAVSLDPSTDRTRPRSQPTRRRERRARIASVPVASAGITFYYWLNTLCTLRPNRPISTMIYTRFAHRRSDRRETPDPYTPGPVINSRSDIVTQRRKSKIKMRWPEVAEVRGVHVL